MQPGRPARLSMALVAPPPSLFCLCSNDFLGRFKGLEKANSKLCLYGEMPIVPLNTLEHWSPKLSFNQGSRGIIERPTKVKIKRISSP